MGESLVGRYYCHVCSQMVIPIMEVEIKCPFCDGGFVEEMTDEDDDGDDVASYRSLSLWAPILLGMMAGRPRRRRSMLARADGGPDSDLDRDLESLLRRRRRSPAVLQLLRGLDDDSGPESGSNIGGGASLGDYFVGPGLDALLQHLAESDPTRYGTPPAKREAVDAMPAVRIRETLSCPVCLEDFEMGAEAREMPCKHRFHGGCILPWLELHSSCPVCRFRIPGEESKVSNGGGSPSAPSSLRGLLPVVRSITGGNSSSNPPSSSSAFERYSRDDEN